MRKIKLKRAYWFLIGLPVLIVIFVLLLLYEPAGYKAFARVKKNKEVSYHITHDFLPQVYNGLQLGDPFNLIASEEAVNDMIGESKWPKTSDGIAFSRPMVLIVEDKIFLAGNIIIKNIDLFLTIELVPKLDQLGLLDISVAKVKIGAVNITPLAGLIARKVYAYESSRVKDKNDNLNERLFNSAFNGQPFDPVFEIDDKKVRIGKITITQKQLAVRLVPVQE